MCGQGGKPGITEELEEVETRAEEFPLTRAFIQVLNTYFVVAMQQRRI